MVHDLVPLITTVCMYRGLEWRVEHGLNMHAVAGHIPFDSSTYIASSRRHFALLAISLAFLLMVRTVWTLTFAVLNFRCTKLLRIESVCIFIFADAHPTILYEIYRLYICTNMCFAYRPYNEACLGCAKSRSSYSKAMTPFRATLLCVLVPRRIILRIRPIPTSSVRSA